MSKILPETQKKIIKTLRERGATLSCPRCNQNNFSIADGYFNNPIQVRTKGYRIGGSSIPTAVIICNNCGYISQHALGSLGLLEKEEKKAE